MNYLQLVQQLASESGTIPDGAITTVVGQTGRKGKLVRWVNEAYRAIQLAHAEWGWLQSEFTMPLTAATYRYAYTVAVDVDLTTPIDRFREWIIEREEGYDSGLTLYDSAVGLSSEGDLIFREYEWFRRSLERGELTTGRPNYFTVGPLQQLRFSPTPDISTYIVKGTYRKSAQTLAVDADIPEMDVDYHDLIVDVAMLALETFDENPGRISMELLRRAEKFKQLERTRMPMITLPGAIA